MIANTKNPETVMDPQAVSLGRVYAEAMADSFDTPERARASSQELLSLADVVRETDGWKELMADPGMNRHRREAMVQRVFGSRVSAPTAALLGVLGRNNRLGILPLVAEQYEKLLNERANRIDVTVRSAVPLTEKQLDRLREVLGEVLCAEPDLHPVVDPNVLGGMVVQVGDTVYDASLGGELNQLRKKLSNR